MGLHSLRILAQAGFSGVFFAAKILRGELPRYRLPLAEFAANVIPCSAPLITSPRDGSNFPGEKMSALLLSIPQWDRFY